MKVANPCFAQVPVTSDAYFASLSLVLARLESGIVDQIVETIWQGYKNKRIIYLFGNGGSAALASHLACDLNKGTIVNGQRRMRAISLTDSVPLLTAWANDSHYDEIFAEPLRNFVQEGDLALAISASGNSPNVIRGLEVAREAGATVMALTGFEGGRAKELCDLCLVVPSDHMEQIEDVHLSVAHAISTAIRQRMINCDAD